MTQSKRSTIILDYQVQGQQEAVASTTQVLAATKQLELSTQGASGAALSVTEQLAALGVSADQVFTKSGDAIATGLIAPLDAADSKIKAVIHDIGDLGNDISALPDPNIGAFAGEGASGAGGGGGISLGGARSGLRAGAGLLGAAAGGGDLRAVGQIVTLTSVLGPLGIIAGIGAEALRAATEAEAARTKAAEDFVNKVAGTAGATTEQLNKQIDAEKQRNQTLAGSKDVLEGFRDRIVAQQEAFNQGLSSADEYQTNIRSINAEVLTASGGTVKLSDNLNDMVSNVSGLDSAITKTKTSIDDSNGTIAFLGVQIGTLATISADTAEEIKKVKDANQELTDQLVKSQVESVNAVVAAQQTTGEDRANKVRQDLEEQAVIHQQLASGNLLQGSHDKLIEQYKSLQSEIELLAPLTNTYADQLKAEEDAKQAITDSNQNYLDTLADLSKAQDAIAKTEGEIALARSNSAAKQQQYRTDAADRIGQLESDDGEKRAQIASDAAEKRQQIDADDGEKRAKIERDANATITNAIYGRNALAAYLAVQKKQQDLADEKKAYDKATTQLDKATQKQLDTQSKGLQKQEDNLRASLERQLRNEEASLARELAAKALVYNQEKVALQNLTSAAATFAQSASAAATQISSAASTIAQASPSQTRQQQIAALPVSASFQLPPVSGVALNDPSRFRGIPGSGRTIGSFATGTSYVPRTGPYTLHKGEGVLTEPQNRIFSKGNGSAGGSLHISVPVQGSQLTARQIGNMAKDSVVEELTKAGWE